MNHKNITIDALLEYCLAINDTGKAQAFYSYSPHTDQVRISVCEPKWDDHKDNYLFIDDVYMSGELCKVGKINNLVKKLVELIKKYEKINKQETISPKKKKLEKSKTTTYRARDIHNFKPLLVSNRDKWH